MPGWRTFLPERPGHARPPPALAHRLKALGKLRGVVEAAVWDADWADARARLTDLRGRLGAPVWQAALDAVTDNDHTRP